MDTPLRDFLEIPYDKLEELNLAGEGRRAWPRRGPRQGPRRTRMKYLTDERAHQGGDRLLHRPRGPASHARLRQEVPAQVGRQPHLRRLLDPRLLAPAGVGPAARHRLARVLLAARRRVRARQGAGVRRGARARRHAAYRGDMRARLKAYAERLLREDGTVAQRRQRDRGLPLQGPRRRAALPRDAASSSSSRPAATTTRCPATRCAASSTPRPRCSARWASRNEKDHPEVAPSQFEMNYGYTEAVVARRPGAALQAVVAPGRGAAWT